MIRERDRAETRCAGCGEMFGAHPNAVVCIEPVQHAERGCRRGGRREWCRKLAGHTGRCRFTGAAELLPADPHWHEACWRARKCDTLTHLADA